MASVNKVILVGNLGADPESRNFPSGDMVTNARLATTEKWKDKQSNEWKELTEWHSLEFTGRLAEIAAEHLHKGSPIYVEGSIRTRKWQDQAGNDRYSTSIRVSQMQMLGGKSEGAGSGGRDTNNGSTQTRQKQAAPASSSPAKQSGGPTDDVPF
ncbi:single-stranded DNA-binding protein [Paraburkholderia phenoliruptrix]|uniref:single-stranded DNA-binding protein n=1 Tax=Paraburkholderia phenoliruptrix TaxID=252970 RepID=UPI0034CE619E